MYVYTTPQFQKQLSLHVLQPEFDKLLEKLKAEQRNDVMTVTRNLRMIGIQRLSPSHYWKKRIENFRLIAKIATVKDDCVLCWLDIFERKSPKYKSQFLNDPEEFGKKHLEPLLNIEQLQSWLADEKEQEQQPTVPPLAPLPSEMRPWLQRPGWSMNTNEEQNRELVIYESEEWVTQFKSPDILIQWDTYYRIINKIQENINNLDKIPGLEHSSSWSSIKLCRDEREDDKYILFCILETVAPIRQILFLATPFRQKPTEQKIKDIGQKIGLFDPSKNIDLLAKQLKLDELTSFALRAYPAYLLADSDSWLAIEKNESANLALSAEEEKILNSVSSPEPQDSSLPIFINGRAGSGKSTMLLYLFADYCYRKFYNSNQETQKEQPLNDLPLFLTYNEKLLKNAREGVERLLSSHHRFLAERSAGEVPQIDSFFQPFQKFILGLLPLADMKDFEREKYISFCRFKQLYLGEPLRIAIPEDTHTLEREKLELEKRLANKLRPVKGLSAARCWHIIRTFIKGYSIDSYMDLEAYQEDVPSKERTISEETFRQVHDTIWKSWYKRITVEEKLVWDDQDLIRKILSEDNLSKYAVVFCDEAQDFTRLELQLIMRLSKLSQYDLYDPSYCSQPICLPFALAGDPLQTLNPTGFRWASVKTAFRGEVIDSLDVSGSLNLDLNFQELKFNYRSSPSIVRFTNLMQLWRRVLFPGFSDIEPQTAWKKGDLPDPRIYVLDESISPEDLKKYAQDTIIIVPCEEGEEISYAREDEVLSKVFQVFEDEPPRNLYSAIAAKGLEFKKVILYKFGETCDPKVWETQDCLENDTLEFEYFFNKLYVGASRAIENLFIVDSQKGYEQLWQYASDEAKLREFVQKSKNQDKWQGNVQTLRKAMSGSAAEIREENPEINAKECEEKGLELQSPEHLRRAKSYYHSFGNDAKAYFCEASALKIDGKLLHAGKLYLNSELLMVDEAWKCFWDGMYWSELVKWYEANYSDSKKTERYIAFFMVSKSNNRGAILQFTEFLETCIGSDKLGNPSSPQWNKSISEYASRISNLSEQILQQDEWQRLGNVFKALDKAGYNEVLNRAGDCLFRARKYQQAIECWPDENSVLRKRDFYKAQAEISSFPKNVEWLYKLEEYQRIVEEWKNQQPCGANEPQLLKYVGLALDKTKHFSDACRVYIHLDDLAKAKESFKNAGQDTSIIELPLQEMITYLIMKKRWQEVIENIEKYLATSEEGKENLR